MGIVDRLMHNSSFLAATRKGRAELEECEQSRHMERCGSWWPYKLSEEGCETRQSSGESKVEAGIMSMNRPLEKENIKVPYYVRLGREGQH